MKQYIWNLATALSQLINTLGGGDPNQTVCSSAWYNKKERQIKLFNFLFRWQSHNHCKESYLNDVRFAKKLLSKYQVHVLPNGHEESQ